MIQAAQELVSHGDCDAARQLLEPVVVSRASGYAEAIIPLALLYERAGDLEDAARLYRLGVESGHPRVGPQAAINLGCLLRDDVGDLPAARAAFEQAAVSVSPDLMAAAELNLAAVSRMQGYQDQAEEGYRRVAASQQPDFAPVAMLKLAELLEDASRIGDARRWYRFALGTGHPAVSSDARSALSRLDSTGRLDGAES